MKLKYKRGTNPNSHIRTKESNIKRSLKLKGRKWTKEQNKKRSKTLQGHNVTDKTKEKIKQSLKLKFPNGKPINSGCFTSERMKRKNNPNWNNGISLDIYSEEWNEKLKTKIKQRDGYICQLCGLYMNEKRRIKTNPQEDWLVVHHIDYNKKNCSEDNLITLCHRCHILMNRNRNKWIEYFKNQKEIFDKELLRNKLMEELIK